MYNFVFLLKKTRKWLLIYLLALAFIVILIPAVIDYQRSDANFATVPELATNVSNKKMFSMLSNNVQTQENKNDSKKKNPASDLTIGWLQGNKCDANCLKNYQHLSTVSPSSITVNRAFTATIQNQPTLVQQLHQMDKSIWPRLIMESDTKTAVHSFLNDQRKRQIVIQQITAAAIANKWDGVNIDIENVNKRDRTIFSAFVEQISNALHAHKITISIDLPYESMNTHNQQTPFDHTALAKYCDYLILMGYDQHWSTDPNPGPTTSLPWLKNALTEMTATGIPAKKIILGLPTYTRIWKQNKKGNIVVNPAISNEFAEQLLQQEKRPLKWDNHLGVYYTEYLKGGLTQRIWFTKATSYASYLQLLSQYHLAGSAWWDLDLVSATYWNKIQASS